MWRTRVAQLECACACAFPVRVSCAFLARVRPTPRISNLSQRVHVVPSTIAGLCCSNVLPMPSWPRWLRPQHLTAPPVMMEHVCIYPVPIAMAVMPGGVEDRVQVEGLGLCCCAVELWQWVGGAKRELATCETAPPSRPSLDIGPTLPAPFACPDLL